MDIRLIEKLWNKTILGKESKCWNWHGKRILIRGERTYGYTCGNTKNYLVHRLSLCIYLGLKYTDDSWIACHICKNKRCWNPLHLYQGTYLDNNTDSIKLRGLCRRGHNYDKVTPKGKRYCSICNNKATRESIDRRKMKNANYSGS